jgi:hypothetical protein
MAIPLVADPSGMAAVILMGSSEPGRLADWSLALFVAWLATAVILFCSTYLYKVLGARVLDWSSTGIACTVSPRGSSCRAGAVARGEEVSGVSFVTAVGHGFFRRAMNCVNDYEKEGPAGTSHTK